MMICFELRSDAKNSSILYYWNNRQKVYYLDLPFIASDISTTEIKVTTIDTDFNKMIWTFLASSWAFIIIIISRWRLLSWHGEYSVVIMSPKWPMTGYCLYILGVQGHRSTFAPSIYRICHSKIRNQSSKYIQEIQKCRRGTSEITHGQWRFYTSMNCCWSVLSSKLSWFVGLHHFSYSKHSSICCMELGGS